MPRPAGTYIATSTTMSCQCSAPPHICHAAAPSPSIGSTVTVVVRIVSSRGRLIGSQSSAVGPAVIEAEAISTYWRRRPQADHYDLGITAEAKSHGDVLTAISNGLVALLKEFYGHGPTRVKTYFQDD